MQFILNGDQHIKSIVVKSEIRKNFLSQIIFQKKKNCGQQDDKNLYRDITKIFLKIFMNQAEPHYFPDRTTESSALGYNQHSHFNQSIPIYLTI